MQRNDQPGYHDLPTSPEIAKQGIKDFLEVAKLLPPKTQTLFLGYQTIKSCFVGINPYINLRPYRGSATDAMLIREDDLYNIAEASASVTRDLVTFSPEPSKPNTLDDLMILNTRAATHIITNNPDYFSEESQKDPVSWLVTSVNDWYMSHSKRGILSGYPVWNTKSYEIHIQTLADLQFDNLSEEEITFHYEYWFGGLEHTIERKNKMGEIIKKAIPGINGKELELCINKKTINDLIIGSFFSFNDKRDVFYLERIKALYNQAGIEKANDFLT